MAKLVFYGGVNEIGGNKILLEDRKTKAFLDFGKSFTFGNGYFTGYLSARAVNGLGDYFAFNLLPKIRGLYSKEQLATTSLPYTEPEFKVIFLSHAHSDHVGHIGFLDPEIEVNLGVGTKILMESIEETSSFCNFGLSPDKEKGEARKCKTFRTGQKIDCDSLTIEPIHVDHSIPAAYGFIIHTSAGDVVYTGDLRMHGPRKDLTEEFMEKAKECDPVAMICEGTRMAENERRKNFTERQVEALSNEIVSSTDKIVFTARYSRDMDRFRTFYQVAKKNGRKIVVSPKTAHLLSSLVHDEHLDLPDPLKDEHILVYYKRKKSKKKEVRGFDEKAYNIWERKFLDKKVMHDFVRKNQGKLVMDLDFYQFTELIDIKPKPGSHFIHSMSEPFSEEDIEDRVMHNWLNHFKMHFHQLHASGHMNRDQLAELVNYIGPKRVFPVHTENQHLFTTYYDNVQLLEYGKEYVL